MQKQASINSLTLSFIPAVMSLMVWSERKHQRSKQGGLVCIWEGKGDSVFIDSLLQSGPHVC